MIYKPNFKQTLQAMFQPRRLFSHPDPAMLSNSFITLGIVLLIGALALWLSALGNAVALQAAREAFVARLGIDPESLPVSLQQGGAAGRLLFPVYWSIIIVVSALLRYLMLKLLGEQRPGYFSAAAVTAYASTPLAISGILVGMFDNLFPNTMADAATDSASLLRAGSVALFVLGAFVWEAIIATTGFKLVFQQNWGRAALTYVCPWLFSFFILMLSLRL